MFHIVDLIHKFYSPAEIPSCGRILCVLLVLQAKITIPSPLSESHFSVSHGSLNNIVTSFYRVLHYITTYFSKSRHYRTWRAHSCRASCLVYQFSLTPVMCCYLFTWLHYVSVSCMLTVTKDLLFLTIWMLKCNNIFLLVNRQEPHLARKGKDLSWKTFGNILFNFSRTISSGNLFV
jgi:hypothetical protein